MLIAYLLIKKYPIAEISNWVSERYMYVDDDLSVSGPPALPGARVRDEPPRAVRVADLAAEACQSRIAFPSILQSDLVLLDVDSLA
ncbi:hypothetical protein A2837_03150 [Candidatus Kaiserbacteria bacterium RIFCSPHIGHO2_01_FULL_46_22]|uniref:Uncharacterized protein n=1 Tax=Candidatus Kaiserbacteria bacterium RIFCSPHIGHO2_01_FULL_46_22 TaxID=1798475 RepID=A0A1F6BX21_9BACT|nr:MAG: hypothetical protein A2837_03150 [Candidatus Kaiserbacteria bacterium RIFCSPHIGHO2_01_FULL_46_22]